MAADTGWANPGPGAHPVGLSRDALVGEVTARLAHLPHAAGVVLACSGGPDSTALAYLVTEARPDLAAVLVHVVHGLREDAAQAADREVVATHAAWLGVDLEVRDVEVARQGHGIEAAARDARYAALRSVAAERRATAIVLGHTADDQAETVLLRLARGTGLDGLGAMAPVRGDLVRPLLRLRRDDLHGFVDLEGLPTSDDASNRDDAIRRVRVRSQVLPALARVGPDPVGALTRLADLARDDAVALDGMAGDLAGAVRQVGPVAVLATEVLRSAPIAVARRVVRSVLLGLVGDPPSVRTVERVLGEAPGGGATLPGGVELRVERRWRTLCAVGAGDPSGATGDAVPDAVFDAVPDEVDLDLPGSTPWPPAAVQVRTITPDTDHATLTDQIAFALPGAWTPPTVRVDPAVVPPGGVAERAVLALPAGVGRLRLRAVRPGDRIATRAGTRRVVEVYREAGVPRAVRTRWPVVVADDRVVWMPGLAVDERIRTAGRADPVVLLSLAPWGRGHGGRAGGRVPQR